MNEDREQRVKCILDFGKISHFYFVEVVWNEFCGCLSLVDTSNLTKSVPVSAMVSQLLELTTFTALGGIVLEIQCLQKLQLNNS